MAIKTKFLITVVGPTAIGKTAMAIRLAQHYNCEIISCDSRQFFKEMTIGTAVPTAEELAFSQHHFIHNKSISDEYTVGDFEKEAIAKLDSLFKHSNFAVLVGGSGLYVDAVLNGFDEFPAIDPAIRERLSKEYAEFGIATLQEQLESLDPDYFRVVDVENPQRLMRALEVCIGSGMPYSSFLGNKKNNREFVPILVGLEADREIIYDRINGRVDIMMTEGLLDEAKLLYPHRNRNALQTVGYRELFAYFDGEFTLDFAVSEIKKNTRRFAKRQLTWFKRNEATTWFNYQDDFKQITKYIDSIATKIR